MKITVKLIWENDQAWTKEFDRGGHTTMMWVRTLLRQVAYTGSVEKMRIDTTCYFGDTHMEIRCADKWTITYVEDEFFCDTAIEFDTRGEVIEFIKDILTNLEQADKAEEECDLW